MSHNSGSNENQDSGNPSTWQIANLAATILAGKLTLREPDSSGSIPEELELAEPNLANVDLYALDLGRRYFGDPDLARIAKATAMAGRLWEASASIASRIRGEREGYPTQQIVQFIDSGQLLYAVETEEDRRRIFEFAERIAPPYPGGGIVGDT